MTWLLLPSGVLVAWLGGAWWLDAHGRRPPAERSWDAIVVAGCKVMSDGRPSPALARRVRLAVRWYESGVAQRIVLTGGVGDHPPSEAESAAALCAALGVPEHALVLEARSTTTEENARFAADLVRGEVLVVSDCYHVYRCRRVFQRHFAHADAVGAVPDDPRSRVRLALREALAVVRHGLAGRLSSRTPGPWSER